MKRNIALVWMPWSGKTTLWRQLAEKTWLTYFDCDDDWERITGELEQDRIVRRGDEWYIEDESNWIRSLKMDSNILSTGWSVPLCDKAMQHLFTMGVVIYLDVPHKWIVKRFEDMKVYRILWMKSKWMTLDEILAYRQSIYNNYKQICFSQTELKPTEEVFDDFWKFCTTHPIVKEYIPA